MKLLINRTLYSHTNFDITLSNADIEELQDDLYRASKALYIYAVHHQLTIKEDHYSFVLYEQKINLDEISANKMLSVLCDFIDFDMEYSPRGAGCEVCFELIEKKERQ